VQYVFAQKCGYLAAYKMTIFMYSFQARSQVLRFVGGGKIHFRQGRFSFLLYVNKKFSGHNKFGGQISRVHCCLTTDLIQMPLS